MISVEVVSRADQRRRFHELGRVLFADEPRWAPVLRPYEAWLFERRHPYHQRAEVVRFLARRSGEVVGRICAHHVVGSDDGWFGAFECADDATAVRGLVQAASEWAVEQGATRLRGPATFTLADEAGVLVEGFEHPGGTARPWQPPWYAEHLAAAGLETDERSFPRWKLSTTIVHRPPETDAQCTMVDALGDDRASTTGNRRSLHDGADVAPGGPSPPQAGKLGDPRIVLEGGSGAVAAVPDISAGLRGTSLRGARQKLDAITEAAIVRLDGDPAALVPLLLAAAATAGYARVWSPWSPDARPPDTVHQVLVADC